MRIVVAKADRHSWAVRSIVRAKRAEYLTAGHLYGHGYPVPRGLHEKPVGREPFRIVGGVAVRIGGAKCASFDPVGLE